MNNLRKFQTEADYSAATLNYPAVSWVTATDNVYFDKSAPTPSFSGLTVYYNITNTASPTELFKGGGGSGSGSGSGSGGVLPSAMIIDGTAVEVTNTYQFSTTGEHIVNYSFADNQVPQMFLYNGNIETFNTVTKVVIGDCVTSIGESAFNSCTSLTSCTIGSGVTSIGGSAFSSCRSLPSIVILDSVTSIGDYAFYRCSGITSCTIGSGVTSIGVYAFNGCSGLTSCTIGSGITSIAGAAFYDCSSLISVTVNAVDPPTLESYAFDNTNNCPIYVPSQSVEVYKNSTSTGWNDYASRIQAIE